MDTLETQDYTLCIIQHPKRVGNFAGLDHSAIVQREEEIDDESLLNEIADLGILLRSALLKPREPRNCVGIVCKL